MIWRIDMLNILIIIRNICSRQVVKEGGAEMLDAQEAHEKTDKKEK